MKNSDSVIGVIAMHPDGSKVEIGYVLARLHWGIGYMTEAARVVMTRLLVQPDIYRIFAVYDVENLASARVIEKAGMQREGLLRKYFVHPNISAEPRNSFIYAIVKQTDFQKVGSPFVKHRKTWEIAENPNLTPE